MAEPKPLSREERERAAFLLIKLRMPNPPTLEAALTIDRYEQTVRQLEEALGRYGQHKWDCKLQTYPHDKGNPLHPCTCGLHAVEGNSP